ncbi:MAG: HU family DNA-binding protein [candidate division WOR-3 bacterium]
MTKEDIVARIAKNANIPKRAALTALTTFTDSIAGALKKGDRVQIIGFGTFMVRRSKARTAKNPRTQELLRIPARKRPVFKPGKGLRDMVK